MFLRTGLFGLKALAFQWWNPEQIREFQRKRLRYLVKHAYCNSRFYRRKFAEHGVDPEDIQTLDDLPNLPLVTKSELRENFSQVVAGGFSEKNCSVETTSGSTGEKITILHNQRAVDYYQPVHTRGHIGLGLRPWHKAVYIRYKPMTEQLMQTLGLFRFEHIYSDLPVAHIIEKLKQITPFTIGCYPTLMYLLATQISEEDAHFLSPHYIMTWSEKLTPKIRNTVEEKFGCPVYDQYGSFECHIMAVECPEKEMHTNADALIMEFVKDGEPVAAGERGEIVVTNLQNEAMPFIRYRIGDIGIPSDKTCACGRGLPVMEGLEGRVDDFLITCTGDIVLPSRVVPIFFPYQQIHAFQIVQKKKDEISIKIVKGRTYSEKIDEEIKRKFEGIFGDKTTILLDHVPEIEKMEGGKQRTIVSELSLD